MTHWQHPRFHAYFPAGNSYPSILADMLSDGLGCVGFSWAASPACTELETVMMDWFGRMIGLPDEFLPFTENANGGGVIQGSASECILVCLLAARHEKMRELKTRFPFVEEGVLLSRLIAYCSKEAHSSVEKACMISMVKLRILETDKRYRLRGEVLYAAIREDRNMGLIPFFVSTTVGTTGCCSFDLLSEIGPICTDEDVWLHVDAAYAGSALICPEFKYLIAGIEHAMSFNTNPNKWMLVNFDCSCLWVKNRYKLTQALVVDPLYLQHSWTETAIDYRHWGIPLSRRFRALKLWFVIRMYGVEGLQTYIREHVRLAKKFEALIRADGRFEIINEVVLGLVCFRVKASDELNQKLLARLNSSGRVHMVPANVGNRFVIRFCVCAERAVDRDIIIAVEIIRQCATHVVDIEQNQAAQNLLEIEEDDEEDKDNETSATQQNRVRHLLPDDPTDSTVGSTRLTLAERRSHSLAQKRSFFVRMVSDPKCYNPKIVRTSSPAARRLSADLKRDLSLRCSSHIERHGSPTVSEPRPGLSRGRSVSSTDANQDGDMELMDDVIGVQQPM